MSETEASQLTRLAPYHILSYGTLLGTQVFQSFVGGIVAFRTIPRPQFASLQQAIFPIYFGMQTALPVVLVLTYPGAMTVMGRQETSLGGVLLDKNRWSVLLPLGTMFLGGLANLALIGPATTKVMRARKHQETRDGKKSYDPAPHSQEMIALNKQFGRLHGISTLVNLGSLIATIGYAFHLGNAF